MTTDKLKELLTVLDTTRQHVETLIKILESHEPDHKHQIANQILKIDLKLIEVQNGWLKLGNFSSKEKTS